MWEGWGSPFSYTAGWCLNKWDSLISHCWAPTCLEQCWGFADDGPSFTQERCCPSPGEASPSPVSSLGSPSWILLILEQSRCQEPGRWCLRRPHPLCSSIHRSHCRSGHLAFTTCPAKFVSGGLNFRFVWPRNSQFCCMCSSVSPSPPVFLLAVKQHKETLCMLLILKQHSFSNIQG